MKKICILLVSVLLFISCEQKEYKYNTLYNQWKGEMTDVNNAHGEALTILDGFSKKIDHHKAAIKQFGENIVNMKAQTTSLSAANKKKELIEIETDLIKNSEENAKKHNHFIQFLNGLTAVKNELENDPKTKTEAIKEMAMPASKNYADLLNYWTKEMVSINKGHDQGLAVIGNLKQHIENHENKISEFGYQIEADKKKADEMAKSGKDAELEKLDNEMQANYDENMKKHKHFTMFLEELKKVQAQFE